jgi:osmotically-inducible protein OsmY
MQSQGLVERIQQQLKEEAHLHIVVAQDHDTILLSGVVGSEEDRALAAHIAARLAPDLRIENYLEVETFLPIGSEGNTNLQLDEVEGDEIPESIAVFQQEGLEFEPGVNNQPLETNTLNVDDDEPDDEEAEEPDTAYFPPTDPVITSDAEGNVEVLGGFAASSDDDLSVQRSAGDDRPGDEALADAIRRELREDALTTDLPVVVEVEQGIAHLSGEVSDVIDAENAEEVASRVPGVQEVVDELEMKES